MADTLSLEVTNSLRLAHQALTEKGRKNTQEASPLEVFYERVWQIALPHKPFQKLQKPGVEAFYSGNMKKDEFVAFFRKNVFSEGHVQDAAALTELCFKTFLTVGSREQEVERCISWQAARQLWQVFAKLDRFGRLGLPNEEVNELLLRVAALSKLETLGSEMSRVATMELVDFWDFLEMLIVQVFQRFKKKVSLKMIQDLHDDIVHELLKRGMLKKRGHVRKNWKDRYFVLTVRHLTYYESQTNLTKKGQLTMNRHSKVMLVTEEGRKAESSARFRVTCGTTGTSTDIIAEDCDDALDWVKTIQVAIAFHRVNERQSRNFLHQLTLARRSVEGATVDVHREVLASPVTADPPFPAIVVPVKNGSSLSTARKSEEPRPHEYEDVDDVADICTRMKTSHTPSSTGRSLSPNRSVPVLSTESEYSVVQKKKTSQPSHAEAVDDHEELPPPVPKRIGAKSGEADLQYVDLRFLSSDDSAPTHDKQRVPKKQKVDHAVEYTDVDDIAMAIASAALNDPTGQSKERKVSPEQHQDGSSLQSKPMKDITHGAHTGRKVSADGDYINITYPEKHSAHSGKKMVDVTTPPKRQLSKDGDYVGVSYDSNGKYMSGHLRDTIMEVPSSAGTKQAEKDYINLIARAEEVENVTSKLMMDVTEESPSKRGGNGDYVGITYNSSVSPAKSSSGNRQRGTPPSIPIHCSADYEGGSYVTVQAPVHAPQPKPRKKIAQRPSSMVESDSRLDVLTVVPEGHRHSRGLTPSPDLDPDARKHDYVMLVPEATVESTAGRKVPPTVPRPYHETHSYMNVSGPQSSSSKPPALPPKKGT